MAITTYAELKTSVADFLNRDDLTSTVPSFIHLAESNINRDVRHWRMEVKSTLNVSSQFTALPTNWLEPVRLTVQSDGTSELTLLSMSEIAKKRSDSNNSTGRPLYYAISGSDIELQPSPSSTFVLDIIYKSRTAALSDSNTTNWLLTYAPDVYLYGTLIHSAPYLKDDERTTLWASLYNAAVLNLNKDSQKAKLGGSGMKMKIDSY